ncbi:hypothetical protein ACWDA7_50535 [Streptomyces sp. NPDC001156]
MLAGFVAHFRDEIAASEYREGCDVAPIVMEVAVQPRASLRSSAGASKA